MQYKQLEATTEGNNATEFIPKILESSGTGHADQQFLGYKNQQNNQQSSYPIRWLLVACLIMSAGSFTSVQGIKITFISPVSWICLPLRHTSGCVSVTLIHLILYRDVVVMKNLLPKGQAASYIYHAHPKPSAIQCMHMRAISISISQVC